MELDEIKRLTVDGMRCEPWAILTFQRKNQQGKLKVTADEAGQLRNGCISEAQ